MAFNFFKTPNGTKEVTQQRYTESFHVKYRPKKLDDVVGQSHITEVLKKSLHDSDMPHLLFYGPPGSGKSSTIKALCNELYSSNVKDFVLELNASDERGIGIVRDRIKNFAQYGSCKKKGSVNFKLIVLDEADNITDDAQTALRRTMETYSRSTRFCLICNHISNINHPLRSRCAVFRFKSHNTSDTIKSIRQIAIQENINIEDQDVLRKIIDINDGDLRKILTQLEILKTYYETEPITTKCLYETSGLVPQDIVDNLMKCCDVDSILMAVNEILTNGYSGTQLLAQIFDYITLSPNYDEETKIHAGETVGVCEYRLMHGSDELIQITNLLSTLIVP